MHPVLWVGLGGSLGSIARYGLGKLVGSKVGSAFPWGTLIVNVLGCLAIGALIRLCEARGVSNDIRLFLTTGLLGGFTTFSAFGHETVALAQSGRWGAATVYVIASVGCGLGAVWMGGRLA